MLTHMSRGSDTSAADFVTGSMLARMIVSERVPATGSSSRLSMPSSRMLIRSEPCQSGSTVFTTEAMLLVMSDGLTGAGIGTLIEPGLIATDTLIGTLTDTGPAATVTTFGGALIGASAVRAPNARQLATKTPPKTTPPRTNAQKATTAKNGGPERPIGGTLTGNGPTPSRGWNDYRQGLCRQSYAASRSRDNSHRVSGKLNRYVIANPARTDTFGKHPPLAAAGALLVKRETIQHAVGVRRPGQWQTELAEEVRLSASIFNRQHLEPLGDVGRGLHAHRDRFAVSPSPRAGAS